MKAKLTITVEMDEAGGVRATGEVNGTINCVEHGRLFAAAASGLSYSFRQELSGYVGRGEYGDAELFAAAAGEPTVEPAEESVTSEVRHP